jgi:hypothetical protein
MDNLYVTVFDLRVMIQEKVLPQLLQVEEELQKRCNYNKNNSSPYMDLNAYYKNYPRPN